MKIFLNTYREISIKKGLSQIGFTLIELITVMVLLSILATIGTGFVVKTTEAYQRTQTRALLVNTSRQALERMTRQLRIALPYSVKVVNSDACIKFLPIVAGGNYYDSVPDVINVASATDKIKASRSDAVNDFGTPRYVTIGAMEDKELYETSVPSIAGYESYSSGVLQLTTTRQWQRNSINKRYYLLDNPQAFCVVGNELRFYEGINLNATDVNVTDAHSIIARNIAERDAADPPLFGLEQGSENRNSRVNISLKFSNGGETILYTQGVFIRNVP
jgi:MSHA biogenesis protein MshO